MIRLNAMLARARTGRRVTRFYSRKPTIWTKISNRQLDKSPQARGLFVVQIAYIIIVKNAAEVINCEKKQRVDHRDGTAMPDPCALSV